MSTTETAQVHNPAIKPDIPPEVIARMSTPRDATDKSSPNQKPGTTITATVVAGEVKTGKVLKYDMRSKKGKQMAAEAKARAFEAEAGPLPVVATAAKEKTYNQVAVDAMIKAAYERGVVAGSTKPQGNVPENPVRQVKADPWVAFMDEYTLAGNEIDPMSGNKDKAFVDWMREKYPAEAEQLYQFRIMHH